MKSNRIWPLVALSLAGYLAIAIWFPLRVDLHHVPLPDIWVLSPSLVEGLAYAGLITLLFLFYWLAFRLVRRGVVRITLGGMLAVAALFCLPLIFTFPINATDIYGYLVHGRIMSIYHQSPFALAPNAFPQDPFAPLTGEWTDVTTPYGPIWVLISAVIARLCGDNLQLGLLLFKGLAAGIQLAITVLIWACLRRADPAQRAARTLLWAWNPALLLIFVVDGHNDGLMLFWLLLGYWLAEHWRPTDGWAVLGLIVMVLAPLTKLIGLLPIPFFLMDLLRRSRTRGERVHLLLGLPIGALALALLSFWPFTVLGDGSSFLELIQRLVQEAAGGGGFSPMALFVVAARRLGFYPTISHLTTAGVGCVFLCSLVLLWQTLRGRSPLRAAADIFAVYLLQAFKFRIWYSAWPFAWLILDLDDDGRLRAGILHLLASQLSVVVYGHLWHILFQRDYLVSHLVGVPLVFGLPLLVVWISRRRSNAPQFVGGSAHS